MLSREELEREVRSLRDRLDYAIEAAKVAKVAFRQFVTEKRRKERGFEINYAVLDALSKESAMLGPMISARGQHAGLMEAAEIAEEMAKKGGEDWHAACVAIAERLRAKK